MNDWRFSILNEFAPQVSPLTLVADPDGILLEERILEELAKRGFELIPFEDSIAFRYLYESKYRARWERGEHTDLILSIRNSPESFRSLPYDVVASARQLSFSRGDIFPNLSYPTIAALDQSDLDALYEAQQAMNPGRLGENATKDFILHHVFQIAPEQIRTIPDFLRVLARRHYVNRQIPKLFNDRLIQLLQQSREFEDWPLDSIVPDRVAFFRFLQERWPIYLTKSTEASSDNAPALRFSGPVDLPFGHPDVRIYIDSMFIEGLLAPVSCVAPDSLPDKWMQTGIVIDPHRDRKIRFEKLLNSINKLVPSTEDRYRRWLNFAAVWAEAVAMSTDTSLQTEQVLLNEFQALRNRIDTTFLGWLHIHYGTLHNQSPVPPVMLHHVARELARFLEASPNHKTALVVVDGLAMDQWVVMRNVLRKQRLTLQMHESGVFAWVPTLTCVSRQSIFAGKPPVLFPASIYTTAKEAPHWVQFWADRGLNSGQVAYLKAQGEGSLDAVEQAISAPGIRVVGIVVDKVDRIMHGMEMGTAGMHNQVIQFSQQGYLARLIDLLLLYGFRITLTSDHGNIEAQGCGRPGEAAAAEMRGERVRIYRDEGLRRQVANRFPAAIEWPPIGIPDDFLPLLAPNRKAFIREQETYVSHGGISIEEVIVPLIEIG
jgi:hypothetical protein